MRVMINLILITVKLDFEENKLGFDDVRLAFDKLDERQFNTYVEIRIRCFYYLF